MWICWVGKNNNNNICICNQETHSINDIFHSELLSPATVKLLLLLGILSLWWEKYLVRVGICFHPNSFSMLPYCYSRDWKLSKHPKILRQLGSGYDLALASVLYFYKSLSHWCIPSIANCDGMKITVMEIAMVNRWGAGWLPRK